MGARGAVCVARANERAPKTEATPLYVRDQKTLLERSTLAFQTGRSTPPLVPAPHALTTPSRASRYATTSRTMSGAPGRTPQRVSFRGFARRTPPREASPEPKNSTEVVEETPSFVLSSNSSDVIITGETKSAPVASAEYVTASAGTTTRTPVRGGTSQSRAPAEATPSSASKRLVFSTPSAKRRRVSRGVRTSLGSDASGAGGAGGGAGAAGTGGAGIIDGWQKLTWKTVRGHLDASRRASTDYQVNRRAPSFQALRLSLTGRLLTESGKKDWWPPWLLCDEHELRTHGVRNKAPGVFAKYASRDQGSERTRDFIDGVARIVTRFLRADECQIPTAAGLEMDEIIGERMSAILHWWNDQRRGASAATEMPPHPPQ